MKLWGKTAYSPDFDNIFQGHKNQWDLALEMITIIFSKTKKFLQQNFILYILNLFLM